MESERSSDKLHPFFATSTTEAFEGSLHYLSGPGQHPKNSYLTKTEEAESGFTSQVDLLKGVDVRSLSRARRISSKSSFSTQTANQRDSNQLMQKMTRDTLDTNFHIPDDYSQETHSQNLNLGYPAKKFNQTGKEIHDRYLTRLKDTENTSVQIRSLLNNDNSSKLSSKIYPYSCLTSLAQTLKKPNSQTHARQDTSHLYSEIGKKYVAGFQLMS